jgi:hypothetical protein
LCHSRSFRASCRRFHCYRESTGIEHGADRHRLHFHQRSERSGVVDGPASVLSRHGSRPTLVLARNETVLLANEQSDPASVTSANAMFGEGTTRLAEVEARIDEKNGWLRLKFEGRDKDLRLKLKLEATVSAAAMTKVRQDPVATPFRALNGTTAASSFFLANEFDTVTVTINEDNFRMDAPHDVLHLPGGDLTLVGMGPAMTLQRWRDILLQARNRVRPHPSTRVE